MRISTTPNATPNSTPPSSGSSGGGADFQAVAEQYIWTSLVPRLVHPTKLAIVETLVEAGEPLTVEGLISCLPAAYRNPETVKQHAMGMVEVGALEVTSGRRKEADANPLFYFPAQKEDRCVLDALAESEPETASGGIAVAHRHHKEG
jgi:hypothetical protein